MIVQGCTSNDVTQDQDPPIQVDAGDPPKRRMGGAELWVNNCMRCHNLISPDRYSDAQWDVVMHHKRLRINLAGEDHRRILAFLKSAN
jgi:hypothetical protein